MAADVVVEPGWGIFGFIAAAVLQLILSHVIIHFHREAEGKHQHMRHLTTGKASVREHNFSANKGSMEVKCTPFGQFLIGLMVFLSAFLVAVGIWVISFTFNFQGAAGEIRFVPISNIRTR